MYTGFYYTFGQNFFSSLQMDPPFSKWATVTPASPRSSSLTSVSITRAHENRVPFLPTNESPVKPNFRFSFSPSRCVNHGSVMVPEIYRKHFINRGIKTPPVTITGIRTVEKFGHFPIPYVFQSGFLQRRAGPSSWFLQAKSFPTKTPRSPRIICTNTLGPLGDCQRNSLQVTT